MLQQLHHPNIVGLKDLYQTKSHFYLVMDLAAGGELFDRILERGFYTEKDAAAVVKQLLEGLVYIHDEVGRCLMNYFFCSTELQVALSNNQTRCCASRFEARKLVVCR